MSATSRISPFSTSTLARVSPRPSTSIASRVQKWMMFRSVCAGQSGFVQRRNAPSSSRNTGAPQEGQVFGRVYTGLSA